MDAPTINGKPAVWIQVGAAEKVNTGNFSNVDIGPVVVGKWVEDLGAEGLEAQLREYQDIVEVFVANERQAVLESLTVS